MTPTTLELPTLRLIAAALAVPVLVLALYKRIGRIASFQKSELARRTPFATARVATAGASVLLLLIIGIAAAGGASVKTVYALLFIEAACVLVYVTLTGAAGFLERTSGRDRDNRV
jgi:hypothetical protein